MADLTSNKQPDKQTPENGELEKSLESLSLDELLASVKDDLARVDAMMNDKSEEERAQTQAEAELGRETEPQKQMENRFHQCHNLDGAFAVDVDLCYSDPVLLVDDVVDSAWTLTLTAALLRQAGVQAVLPFALATTAAK